jgi:hypothetical protein
MYVYSANNFELMYDFSSNLTLKVAHKFFWNVAKLNNSSKSKLQSTLKLRDACHYSAQNGFFLKS